jgi:exonuclease III
LRELQRLQQMSINEKPTNWLRHDNNSVKVASLNCAGLKPHFIDIQADSHLLKADVIHLIETSLDADDNTQFTLPGYSSHFINIGNGKGIATYYKTGVVEHEQDLKENNMQITKFTSSNLDVVNIYRSSNGHSVELLNHILKMTPHGKPVLITGDFNICYQMNRTNRLIQGLETNGFQQLVNEATHIRGRHIDHAYWRDRKKTWADPAVDRYSPYYSDHDAIGITMTRTQTE